MQIPSHRTLLNMSLIAGLAGQFLLESAPVLAIILMGVCLAAALVDGWYYLTPLKARWYSALLGLYGLTMWDQPRGWFFMAWGLIDLGTGWRADRIIHRYHSAVAAEQARQERLAQLGFGADAEEAASVPEHEPAPAPFELPPLPAWRYVTAVLAGGIAAWVGAWVFSLVLQALGIQMDIFALGLGYLVGRAAVAGAGGRSTPLLRLLAAAVGLVGAFYGRYLWFRAILYEGVRSRPPVGEQLKAIFEVLGLLPASAWGFFLLMAVVAGWAGWRFAYQRERA